MASLRRSMEFAGNGMGVAESLVRSLAAAGPEGKKVARSVLLGFPASMSVRPLLLGDSAEVAMLASLVCASARSSSLSIGKNGERLSHILEAWVKDRENRTMEERVQRFRSLVASCVMGAVCAMIGSLGPLLGSLYDITLAAPAPPHGANLALAAGAAMTAISSAMLASFASERRIYINVILALASFGVVCLLAMPLTSFTLSALAAK